MQTANRSYPIRAGLVVLEKVAEHALNSKGGPLERLAKISAAVGKPIGPNKLNVGDRQRSHFQHQHSLDLLCPSVPLTEINSGFTCITFKCTGLHPSRRTKTPSAARAVKIPAISATWPSLRHYGPVKSDTINQSPFNLDNFTFIRYIYFKCNKTSAGALIRIRLSFMLLLRAAARRIDRRR
jgi:hypothetical protein